MSLGASSFTNGPKVARPRSVPASAIKRKAPKQVAVSRTIVSKPNTADQVERLCKEAYEHALQVTAADIVSFDFWRDPVAEDGPVFHFYEVYGAYLGSWSLVTRLTRFARTFARLQAQSLARSLFLSPQSLKRRGLTSMARKQ